MQLAYRYFSALAEPTFDSFPKLIDSAVPEPEADTVEIPSGTPEKKEEDTVAELEEVMEEIAIESAIVDEVKEEEEVTVAQKKEERSTVAPQQADTVSGLVVCTGKRMFR